MRLSTARASIPHRPHPAVAVLATGVVTVLAGTIPAAAQAPLHPAELSSTTTVSGGSIPSGSGFATPGWAVDAGLAGANALLGGTVVSLARWARGESFLDSFREGFGRGALAGVGAYGGRRLAAERFTGAGLLGRQLHGVAVSGARSVAAGRGLTDELSLFLGPLRLHLRRPPGPDGVWWSVSGLDLYWLVYGVADSRFSLDWGESLSGGAPVFRPDQGRRILAGSGQVAGGAALGGAVFVSDGLGESEARLLAHERVHVLQFDFLHSLVSQSVEGYLIGLLPGGDHVRDRLHPDLLILGVGGLLGSRAESRRAPWEVEAHLLEGR